MILPWFGEDEYIGLAGQDKNRISDTLDICCQLRAIWRPTTVEQVFLDSQINLSFPKHLQEAQWLAVLFAVGVDESHAAFAKGLQGIRLQSNSRGI